MPLASGRSHKPLQPPILPRPRPGGGTGRHSRLKICRPHGHGSSILPLGTTTVSHGRIPANTTMNFCSNCGNRVTLRVPPGDQRPRFVCDSCGTIHYENPRVVVGCVPEHEGRILLCKRAIEPRLGYWTVPAGFMENGESLQQGAARECYEEALADVEIGSLLAMVTVLGANQVHVFFRAKMRAPTFGAGSESLEVKLVTPGDIPWNDIAFQSTTFALQHYLQDRAAGREDYHHTVLDRRRPEGSRGGGT
jgi:ADP-ribose pyrophosphatase YjhB (NUDIX family)